MRQLADLPATSSDLSQRCSSWRSIPLELRLMRGSRLTGPLGGQSDPARSENHELMAAGHAYRLRFASLFVR